MEKQVSKTSGIDYDDLYDINEVIQIIESSYSECEHSFGRCDFNLSHIESLKRARLLMLKHLKKEE